jgi:glucuronoxylan 4-O-methyltransferase
MELPDEVGSREWDIILVDGPRGWRDDQPGRMKSIFAASRLIGRPGDVFVHDCERAVENVYSNKFLGHENLKRQLDGSSGLLRHYRLAG